MLKHRQILFKHPQIILLRPQLLLERPQVLLERPQILLEHPQVLLEHPQVILERMQFIALYSPFHLATMKQKAYPKSTFKTKVKNLPGFENLASLTPDV